MDRVRHQAIIPEELSGQRLDRALAALFTDYSRSRLQQWLRAGWITVDGAVRRARDPVRAGERIHVDAEPEPETTLVPEAIPLSIVYEDDDLLVVDKPAGLVVHPGAGNPSGTLVNALLYHDPTLEALPRAGVVHRLDKDTTGLLVVARRYAAHNDLVAQLQARSVGRGYQALVVGCPTAGGRVDAPIARHPRDRKRMAVVADGRPALTHYRVAERFAAHTLLDVRLETGRTHQIRVHMAHVGLPLLGDPVYGRRPVYPRGASEALRAALDGFPRQALHARYLSLTHPRSGERLSWEAPLPGEWHRLLEALRAG
ncbi:MAG: 23S rRNA pseudouridine(1911/1915/1917) synthase RluD [Halorhodospira sp.]